MGIQLKPDQFPVKTGKNRIQLKPEITGFQLKPENRISSLNRNNWRRPGGSQLNNRIQLKTGFQFKNRIPSLNRK